MSPAGVAGRGADGGAQDGVRQVAHLCDSFEGADVGPRQEVVELAKRAGVRAHDARDGGPEVRPGRPHTNQPGCPVSRRELTQLGSPLERMLDPQIRRTNGAGRIWGGMLADWRIWGRMARQLGG
ncbi:hypothetical protein PtB15_4B545 [Puccinia triticina]|nr:hypothetical protein PtB15_4B545 [Puccinia triticina]